MSECGTHAFLAAVVDAYAVGEKTMARRLYPRLLGDETCEQQRNEDHAHGGVQRPALAAILHELAEREAQCGADQKDRKQLDEVRDRRRILERMGLQSTAV